MNRVEPTVNADIEAKRLRVLQSEERFDQPDFSDHAAALSC